MQYRAPDPKPAFEPAKDALGTAPPYSLEAEQAFLGSLLVWNDVIDDVPFLEGRHFFDALHENIFNMASSVIRQGRSATPLTLMESFKAAEPIDATTTVPQYLGRLGTNAAPRGQAKACARTIVDLSVRRQLMLVGEDLAEAAREASAEVSPSLLIEDAEKALFSLAERHVGDTATLSLTDALSQAVAYMDDAYSGKRSGLRTGLIDLDAKLGGLQDTDLIVLAGRPSMGKTALATNIAFHVARTQKPVHFFSLEMSAQQLAMRILGEQSEIPASRLRTGKVTEAQVKRAMETANDLGDTPLFTDEIGGASIAQVTARARRLKRKKDIGLIVIDYLQLMRPSHSRANSNRVQDITEITTGLKALAKELRVPVIALSQLSRETEKRENKRPQLSDLRESGSIEQDADVVMFAYREEYYVEREEPTLGTPEYKDWQHKLEGVAGKAEIIVGKHRHGELGAVQVAFRGDLTRFSNLAKEAR